MAATKGNKFWELRSKHGRDKLFESPELLLSVNLYFKDVKEYNANNKLKEYYSIPKLATYLGTSRSYIKNLDIFEYIEDRMLISNIRLYNMGSISHNIISNKLNKHNLKINTNNVNDGYIVPSGKTRDISNCKTGVIYLINAIGTDYYKIGISGNLKRRLRDLSSANPFNIQLLVFKDDLHAFDTEQFLHEKYHKYAIKNEWFDFPLTIVEEIIKLLKNAD